ncbi:MAG TPA: hypothetical protein VN783_02300, partial [Thermoanaerobaculia bacterium]|nr:hypothetical protein [Thermoanaerobaculia bacterium]
MTRLSALALGAALAATLLAPSPRALAEDAPAAPPIPCTADLDCTNRAPFCLDGACRQPTCATDAECPHGLGCSEGKCIRTDCTTAADCKIGKACFEHRCVACNENRDCGERGTCENHGCVCVACSRDEHCAPGQKCDGRACVSACGERELFVARRDGDRLCTACIRLADTGKFPSFGGWPCADDDDCPGARQFCAQGFCIDHCAHANAGFDVSSLPDLGDLPFLSDPSGAPPPCPRCTLAFLTLGIRGVLERAGLGRPVRLTLLDPDGRRVADLGTFAPQGGSWST